MSAGPRRQEPLWLDLQLSERLSNRFRLPAHAQQTACLRTLRLWQWQHLCRTAERAKNHSLHYRQALSREDVQGLIAAAAGQAGLPVPCEEGISREVTADNMPEPDATAACMDALLARLPFTLPSDLERQPAAFLAVPQDSVSGLISLPTSGSTGPGKRVYCTTRDLLETAAFFRHGMQYMVRPGRGDSVALLMGGDRPGSVGDLLQRGMADLGVPCAVPGFVDPGPEGAAAMLRRLKEIGPTCIVGVPGQIMNLSCHAKAPGLGLRSILLSGDVLTSPMRRGIAEGFGCEVFLHYGLTETGLGGAVECREHNGCHLREADLLVEIVDEAGGPRQPGEWGEIVITTLTREAMPLLRYRTGDEGRIAPDACACGSLFRRLFIRGRMRERVPLPGGGSLHITDLDNLLFHLPIRGFSAALHEFAAGTPACLVLRIKRSRNAPDSILTQAATALKALPGVWPVLSARDVTLCPPAYLPVLLLEDAAQESGDDIRRRQAKRIIMRTAEPLPGIFDF